MDDSGVFGDFYSSLQEIRRIVLAGVTIPD